MPFLGVFNLATFNVLEKENSWSETDERRVLKRDACGTAIQTVALPPWEK